MADEPRTTTTIEASFADAAQAERAAAQLQAHGVPDDRIEVEHGHTSSPGRTAAEDQGTTTRLVASWWGGVLVGAIVGGLIGAVVGALTFGIGTGGFWGLTLGCGGGGAGVGALWGMFAGFAGRSRSTRTLDEAHRPQLTDAVRLLVAVDDAQLDSVRRIIREKGGTL